LSLSGPWEWLELAPVVRCRERRERRPRFRPGTGTDRSRGDVFPGEGDDRLDTAEAIN